MVIRGAVVGAVLLAVNNMSAYAQAVRAPDPDVLPKATVVDNRGVETKGRLLTIDDEAIVLIIDGDRRRFELRNVNRVTRAGDSLKNGAIAGAIVGLVEGVVANLVCEGCHAGYRLSYLTLTPTLFAALGTGIDAAIQGRTTIYQAPPPKVSGAPKGAASIGVRVSW